MKRLFKYIIISAILAIPYGKLASYVNGIEFDMIGWFAGFIILFGALIILYLIEFFIDLIMWYRTK